MLERFYQYLYSLSFVLLTVLGLYYGQMQQYISTDIPSDLDFSTDVLIREAENAVHPLAFLKDKNDPSLYGLSRPAYNKIRAVPENDSENDENPETSDTSDFILFLKEDFWSLMTGFVRSFHNRQIAVSLAYSQHLKLQYDDLYIHYRVIRL
ncbi:hypothetical protein VUJ46_01585 [Chryseobacterium sp. MYb264]|uniref:hypothetical protein n=1 Tax=Chryseobacterium sp. MYb264 TaxID=2745153 RepID=UPI002E122E30|nr:hypothetical protein VUJ46_01585 [Chryseobacterium sp. MYb264]